MAIGSDFSEINFSTKWGTLNFWLRKISPELAIVFTICLAPHMALGSELEFLRGPLFCKGRAANLTAPETVDFQRILGEEIARVYGAPLTHQTKYIFIGSKMLTNWRLGEHAANSGTERQLDPFYTYIQSLFNRRVQGNNQGFERDHVTVLFPTIDKGLQKFAPEGFKSHKFPAQPPTRFRGYVQPEVQKLLELTREHLGEGSLSLLINRLETGHENPTSGINPNKMRRIFDWWSTEVFWKNIGLFKGTLENYRFKNNGPILVILDSTQLMDPYFWISVQKFTDINQVAVYQVGKDAQSARSLAWTLQVAALRGKIDPGKNKETGLPYDNPYEREMDLRQKLFLGPFAKRLLQENPNLRSEIKEVMRIRAELEKSRTQGQTGFNARKKIKDSGEATFPQTTDFQKDPVP